MESCKKRMRNCEPSSRSKRHCKRRLCNTKRRVRRCEGWSYHAQFLWFAQAARTHGQVAFTGRVFAVCILAAGTSEQMSKALLPTYGVFVPMLRLRAVDRSLPSVVRAMARPNVRRLCLCNGFWHLDKGPLIISATSLRLLIHDDSIRSSVGMSDQEHADWPTIWSMRRKE